MHSRSTIWRKMYSLYKLNNIIHLRTTLSLSPWTPLCTVPTHMMASLKYIQEQRQEQLLTSMHYQNHIPYFHPRHHLQLPVFPLNLVNKFMHQNCILFVTLARKIPMCLHHITSCVPKTYDNTTNIGTKNEGFTHLYHKFITGVQYPPSKSQLL